MSSDQSSVFALTRSDAEGWREFSRRVFAPSMPRLAEVSSAAAEVLREHGRRSKTRAAEQALSLTRPEVVSEVWEMLCTRLDAIDWMDDGTRAFFPFVNLEPIDGLEARRAGAAARGDDRLLASTSPLNVETAVALLSAPREVIRSVESMAIEAARRLEPWGTHRPKRVVWIMLSMAWPYPSPYFWTEFDRFVFATGFAPQPHLSRSDIRALSAREADLEAAVMSSITKPAGKYQRRFVPRLRALEHARRFAVSWDTYRRFCRDGAIVSADYTLNNWIVSGVAGKRWDDVPDALDPLLRILGLGYALVDIRGDAVVLGAPASFRPISAPSWEALSRAQSSRYGRPRVGP